MSIPFEMNSQQINECTTLVCKVQWLPDDHLGQGEPAQSGPEQVADGLAPSSPTERIKSTPEAGQLVPEIGQVLVKPWSATGSRSHEDLKRGERRRIAECVPAGVDNGLHPFARRTVGYFHIVDRTT
jgi:hypothetical protein